MNFDSIKQFFSDYFNGNQATGIIRFIVDVLVVCGIVVAFFFFIHKRINVWRLLIVLAIGVATDILNKIGDATGYHVDDMDKDAAERAGVSGGERLSTTEPLTSFTFDIDGGITYE